ncbi:MAG TPA: hypothetical protein DCW90_16300 [Lachnospiraceae bacterium]|nr:hypothetical protein [uncultured Lachnoclostridium sp.]HAU86987.1 hypothetical protein [Lachnospiraceae bacterium]
MEKNVVFSTSAANGLPNGAYRVTVHQQLDPSCEIKDYMVEDASLTFQVAGETVVMNENEVYSVYPPKDSVGQFKNCIPHIVLHRKTFPWEYTLSCQTEEPLPYVALLVISEDEPVVGMTTTYEQSRQVEQNVYVPKVESSCVNEDATCRVADFEKSFFMAILPTLEDLPYMAHTKGVDLDDKVTDQEVKDAWFSCVLANRYPKEATGEENIRHTAYLVSLAGYEKWLMLSQEERKKESSYDFFRMYVLYQWNFQVEPQPYNFYEIANHLHAYVYAVEEPAGDEVQAILNQGYVPMDHTFREGSETVSWYRSPFLPGKMEQEEIAQTYHVADELLRYDPEMGMFDISYSAAWQLGRMLTLKNAESAKHIMNWRGKIKLDEVKNQNRMMLAGQFGKSSMQQNIMNAKQVLSEAEWKSFIEKMIHSCNDSTEE